MFIRSDRGVSTSLIEAVVVIAIAAVLLSVGLSTGLDKLEDSKVSKAEADTKAIGLAIHSFVQDTGFAPAFKDGDAHGPAAEIFLVLETEGADPSLAPDLDLNWPEDPEDRDLLGNHLIKNQPSGSEETRYPRVGEISYARFKGWAGPYLAGTSSDPWNDKYLVNIKLLTPQGEKTLSMETGQRAAVFVVSAGPNRQLETRFDQVADAFVAGGDDIIFRIQ
jgi:type II secretory pathway pseudopilin PulG